MLVASVDVGITHLALVFGRVTELVALVQAECLDITMFEHDRVPIGQCRLGHTKTTADRIAHVVQQRQHLFDACTHVLIERQPLQGHTHVEQVLYLMLRNKAQLVSPNAMHKFFNIGHYTYEGRKQQVVRIVDELFPLDKFPLYHALERKHDIADAVCLLLFWVHSDTKPRTRVKQQGNAKITQMQKAQDVLHDEMHDEAVTAFANFTNKFRCQFKVKQHVTASNKHA